MHPYTYTPAPYIARVEDRARPAYIDERVYTPRAARAQLDEERLPLASHFVEHEAVAPEEEGERLAVARRTTRSASRRATGPTSRRSSARRAIAARLEATRRRAGVFVNLRLDPDPQMDRARQSRRVEDPILE
jgi:hypothetical protein